MIRSLPSPATVALALVALLAVALPTSVVTSHAAPTLVVNTAADAPDTDTADGVCDTGALLADGTTRACSLRAALEEANASAVADSIAFAVADADGAVDGAVTLRPATALPDVTAALVLDATTQPGYAGTPVVELDGALTTGADGLTVTGGPAEVAGLAVHSFDGAGIALRGTTDTLVRGNVIVGNGAEGVLVDQGVDVRIGGTAPGDGNRIASNAGAGVALRGAGLDDVSVLGNALHDNGGLGIDLDDDGLTPNDAGDGDGGANASLNFPVPLGATPDEVAFDLDVPAGTYRIEVFRNPGGADPSGHGEGEELVGVGTVVHPGGGAAGFVLAGLSGVAIGDVLTMTATEDLGAGVHGSTSEFSAAVTADEHLAVVNSSGDEPDTAPGDGVCATAAPDVDGVPACTLRAALEEAAASALVDEVRFTVPATDPGVTGGVVTITPITDLPAVTDRVLVDGSTQPGWADEPVVVVDGSGTAGDLLHVTADDTTLRALALVGAGRDGLHVDGAARVVLEGSHVAGSARDGVRVVGTADDVAVVGTTFADSGGLGIDLGGDGVTANDPGDVDTGPNGLLNRPVVTGAAATAGIVTLEVELDQAPGDALLQVFTSATPDPSGAGEGEVLVHRATVTHPGGVATHTLTHAGDPATAITVTATEDLGDGYGATSEFSDAAAAPATEVPGRDARVVRDSTGNGRDGVPRGGMTTGDAVAGRIGGALDLDGVDDRVEVGNLDVAGDGLTVSAWVDVDTIGADPTVLARAVGIGAVDVEWRLLLADISATTARAAAEVRTAAGLAGVVDPGPLEAGAGWVHLTARYDGSDVVLFVDGTAVASAPHSGALRTDPTVPTWIGGSPGGDGLDGRVDEVTVSGTARSDGWVAATHATQADPAAALTVGATQTEAPGGWSTSTAQARSGSASALAPSGVLRSWLTLDGVAESGLEAVAWWRVNTLDGLDLGQGVRAGDAGATGLVRQDEVGLVGADGFDLAQVDGARSVLVAPPAGQSPAVDAWQRVVLRIDPAGRLSATAAGADVPTTGTAAAGVAPTGSVGLRVGALDPAVRWWIDDLRLRRYVAPEPVTRLGRTELAP